MKDWRQKLTIDWPCALGDWLWLMLVVEPARMIDKINRRRVLHLIGIVLLLLFFQQVVALDLTFLFGVDLGLLMEISAAVFILVAREQGKAVLITVRQKLTLARPRLMRAFRRGARRIRSAIRPPAPPTDDDHLAGALA
ncbi:MAG TPA: hypothetical protein VFI23_14960 [Rhizomicrobium sp.]|nr:hypothetical protein [Rhizomicrobium sp.]